MTFLSTERKLTRWSLLRRKLGLGQKELGEFHLMMEFSTLDDLDQAFSFVASRTGEVEAKHARVNQMIDSISFSLYRDFPDAERKLGGELF